MAVTENRVEEGFVTLKVDDQEVLAVRISGHTRSMAGQMQSFRRGAGWIVTAGAIDRWQVLGLIQHEGSVYAYGPYRDHTPITTLFDEPADRALAGIGELVSGLRALLAADIELSRFQPNLLLRLTPGGLLFLPPGLIEGILSSQTEEQRVRNYEPFNHPDLKGERNACFLLGVLAYRVVTGRLPFEASSAEEVHERIREAKVLPPQLAVPELRSELSELIVRSLSTDADVSLEEWQAELTQCRSGGHTRQVSDEERHRIAEAATKFEKSSEAGFRRKVYFRKNWRAMVITVAIIAIVGAVGGSILKNALKPRITVGMSPKQVVSLYYTSMSTFNSQAMQDCVIDGAGKAAISEATNLYVITRVRTGYEGSSGYMTAQKWIDQGKPKLAPGKSVYGVADLTVTQDSNSVYTVNYQKWEPDQTAQPPANNTKPVLMRIQGWQRQDRVYLKNEGTFWAIYRIDRRVNKKIGPPVTVTNPTLKAGRPSAPAAIAQ